MTTYAVTAAGGRLGRLVVDALLERGVDPGDVVAVVRYPARAGALAALGVQVREGDYRLPAFLRDALAGVDRLLLVCSPDPWQRVAHHANVIRAARAVGVGGIAYTSLLHAPSSPLPAAAEHRVTERLLRTSGIPSTVLRTGWCTEEYTDRLPEFVAAREVVAAVGAARVAPAARADLAGAAAAVLVQDAHAGAVYELAGAPFTYAALARAVGALTGVPVRYRAVSTAGLVAHLVRGGVDEHTARARAAAEQAVAAGALDTDRTDLADLLGRPATTLAEVLRAAAPALAA
ncbi:SDR family oxidoreductase [Kineococcus sp. NUM-3379]